MGILNPVVSKFALTQGTAQEVYACPAGKSHAVIDITFFKDDIVTDSLIGVALATESNPANLTSVDFFVDDIQLISTVNTAELNKVIVGQGERLFVKVMSGTGISVRVSGVEEANPVVLKGGRLAAASIAGTAITALFTNALSNVAYISASVTIFNMSAASNAQVELWISSGATPEASDKVMLMSIPPEDTTIIENVLLSPNEKLFVRSSQPNTEYFVNGIVIAAS